MTLSEIVAVLSAHNLSPHKNCSGWTSRCPAHDDKTPSLSINESNETILLKCHAGCSFVDIVAALGIKPSDCFPPPPIRVNGSTIRRRVAEYPYTDESGTVLFRKVRFEPKDFRIEHPDPNRPGEFLPNIGLSRRVLFRLPETIAAIAAGHRIFICEGEKDVLAMVANGFDATTSFSSSSWIPDYTEIFTGADVVIVEDHDPAGAKHAATRATALHGVAASVRIIRVPDINGTPCKDPADFFAAGGSPVDLLALADSVTDWCPEPQPDEPDPDQEIPRGGYITPSTSDRFIILPSDHTPILQSATAIFQRFGDSRRMYNRSGVVMELVPSPGGGSMLATVAPDAFRSRLEGFGIPLVSFRVNRDGDLCLGRKVLSVDSSRALLASKPARETLPPIVLVTGSPVLAMDGDQLVAIGEGYSPLSGGIYVTHPCNVVPMSTDEAVATLLSCLDDFIFISPGDKSRAAASLITPAFKMAGLIRGFCPLEVSEARESQSGKGYRDRITHAIYNCVVRPVARKNGGVGSIDESIASEIISGRDFVEIDNVRGKLDSQYLESILTSSGEIECRVPGQRSAYVDARRITFQLTSNGMESTPDLANRCSIVRIAKKSDRSFKKYPEGDLESHIRANRGRFIGAVFQIVRHWHASGSPCVPSTEHDFRQWAGVLDPLIQNTFRLAPLLQDHEIAKARVSNSALSWLRLIAIQALKSHPPLHPWSASDLAELAETSDTPLPNSRASSIDDMSRSIGRLMSRSFKPNPDGSPSNTITVDGIIVCRQEYSEHDPKSRCIIERKSYLFQPDAGF